MNGQWQDGRIQCWKEQTHLLIKASDSFLPLIIQLYDNKGVYMHYYGLCG